MLLRWGLENCFLFYPFSFYLFIDGYVLWLFSRDEYTHCKSLWTKRLLNALNANASALTFVCTLSVTLCLWQSVFTASFQLLLLESFDLTGLTIFTAVVLRPHCAASSCQTSDVCLTHVSTLTDLHQSLTIREHSSHYCQSGFFHCQTLIVCFCKIDTEGNKMLKNCSGKALDL